MGAIPDLENWTLQVSYQTDIEEIKNLKKVDISQTDLDVARLQNRDIEELKRERLIMERKTRIAEINNKYGIKNKIPEIEMPDGIPSEPQTIDEKKKLWDILQGKGLIKNGLQDKT